LTPENRRVNIAAEWDLSEEAWATAEDLRQLDRRRGAISQYYFAVFHAALAGLISRDVQPKTHTGVKTEFSRIFVSSGVLNPSIGRLLRRREDEREEADYVAGLVFTKDDVEEARDEAGAFREAVRELLTGERWLEGK